MITHAASPKTLYCFIEPLPLGRFFLLRIKWKAGVDDEFYSLEFVEQVNYRISFHNPLLQRSTPFD